MARDFCFHSRGHFQRTMPAAKIVMGDEQADAGDHVFKFLAKPSAKRVNRRRKVRTDKLTARNVTCICRALLCLPV